MCVKIRTFFMEKYNSLAIKLLLYPLDEVIKIYHETIFKKVS